MLKRERTHRARTGMVKKVVPRLRDPAFWLPLTEGASSRNLVPTFFTVPEGEGEHTAFWRGSAKEKGESAES